MTHRLATVSTLIHRKHPIVYLIHTYCILIMLASEKNRLLNIFFNWPEMYVYTSVEIDIGLTTFRII